MPLININVLLIGKELMSIADPVDAHLPHFIYITQELNIMNNPDLTHTIDQIIDHHYFRQRLKEMVANVSSHSSSTQAIQHLQNHYYTAEDDLIEQISDTIGTLCQSKTRMILNDQFVNVSQQIIAIKKQMFSFMDQQNSITTSLRKEVAKLTEQNKRRVKVTQVTNNTPSIGSMNSGIRFSRSNQVAQEPNTGKSYYSELSTIRKQIEDLKESIVNGEGIQILRNQLNQFRIQIKVGLEGVKQQSKKNSSQLNLLKSQGSQVQSMKPQIEGMVKRGIKSQLHVVGEYAQQINEIKGQIEEFDEKLQKQTQNHQQYLSSQLKSLWMVMNDLKKSVDSLSEEIGLNRSTDIIL